MIPGLVHNKLPVEHAVMYQNDGRREALGPYGGQFPVDVYLAGHGSTCATTITATAVPTLLGRLLGTSTTDQVGTTVASATDADTFANTAGTFKDGCLTRVGAIDDARGNGQWVAIDTETALAVELLTATDATVQAADVVYAAEQVHCNEGTTAPDVSPSLRFNLQSANQRLNAWGCFLGAAPTFSGFNAGEIPRVSLPIAVSQWGFESASTYPTTTSVDDFVPAVVAAGSMFVQTHGTTTRALQTVRNVEFSIDYQVQPLFGPGSDNAQSVIIGARRLKCQPMISFDVDAEAAGTQTWSDNWASTASTAYWHILYSMSCTNGSAMGLYLPRCKLVDQRPTQTSVDGLNRVRVSFVGLSDVSAGTTELERSAWRMAFG
jgi:hypothetical protein